MSHVPFSPAGPSFRRRTFLTGAAGVSLLPFLNACGKHRPKRHNIVVGINIDPLFLTSAISSDGPAQLVTSKIFDGLLTYGTDLQPQAALAVAWESAPDNRSLTLRLRPRVRWHDNQPFTSGDVAFSLTELWKKYHSRGRTTFANVTAVHTPDDLTVVLELSEPSPYILNALGANESQVVPRHLYEGRDVLSNPANTQPVGTGPYRFQTWKRGSHITLERNPAYWRKDLPAADQLIFRIIADSASLAAAVEAGEVHIAPQLSPSDVERLARIPQIVVDRTPRPFAVATLALDFNLDLDKFRNVVLRRAIAHAIDREFILKTILYGEGSIATGPIPAALSAFYTSQVPDYAYSPAQANSLLDGIGLTRGADGTRLSFTLDPTPTAGYSIQIADYVRSALAEIGIRVVVRQQDFASFVKRLYTDRDFEAALVAAQMGPDPAIGMQRFYWSKSFHRGVAFANTAHYDSPAADAALEAAQSAPDLADRRRHYEDFQVIAQTDLPRIPLVDISTPLVYRDSVSGFESGAAGIYEDYASLRLKS
ncbi:MAG: ABC transporter substrate-binding protein [Acetobacter sp.]